MVLSHQLAAGPSANTEGLVQVGELGLGLLLSAVIGLEREVRQKSAGLRTHSLVGVCPVTNDLPRCQRLTSGEEF
jgi:MgtC family